MIKCNTCGGAVYYDIVNKKIRCRNCDNTYEIDEIEESDEPELVMNQFLCPECGGEIYSNDDTAQGFCSFCGSSTTLAHNLTSWKKPKKIIPFTITKDEAVEEFLEAMRKNPFAPDDVKSDNHITAYRGIYIPYWSYEAYVKGTVNKNSFIKSDTKYTYYYDSSGDIDLHVNGIIHDASTKMPDDIGEGLAPYNMKAAVDFHSAYLSGFYADTSNVQSDAYENFVDKAMRVESNKIVNDGAYSLGLHKAASQNKNNTSVDVSIEDAMNCLCPVWLISYQKNKRLAYAAINGQTGELICDSPVDKNKYIVRALILSVILFVIATIFVSLTPGKTLLMSSIFTALMALCLYNVKLKIDDKEKSDKIKIQEWASNKNKKAFSIKGFLTNNYVLSITMFIISAVLGLFALTTIVDYSINRNDNVYYLLVLFENALNIAAIGKIIGLLNYIALRKLPHFDYQGGNTNA